MGKDKEMDNLVQYWTEIYKNNHMDIPNIKITITGNKNPLGIFNSSPNEAEVRISDVEDRSVDSSKLKDREKKKKKEQFVFSFSTVSFAEQKFLIKMQFNFSVLSFMAHYLCCNGI